MRLTMLQSDLEPGDLILEVNTRGDVSMYVLAAVHNDRAVWLELDGRIQWSQRRLEALAVPLGVRLIVSSSGEVRYDSASELVERELRGQRDR